MDAGYRLTGNWTYRLRTVGRTAGTFPWAGRGLGRTGTNLILEMLGRNIAPAQPLTWSRDKWCVVSRANPRGPAVPVLRGVRRAPAWQIVVPVLAIAILGYTIDKQVAGQTFPYDRFPFVVAIWLLVGLAIVVAVPGLARRIGVGLAREEGLAADDAAAASGS